LQFTAIEKLSSYDLDHDFLESVGLIDPKMNSTSNASPNLGKQRFQEHGFPQGVKLV
jgi:hypothetical protein